MNKYLKKTFSGDFKNPHYFILFLPYLIYTVSELIGSPLYSFSFHLILLGILFLIDLLLAYANQSTKASLRLIAMTIYWGSVIFLYSQDLAFLLYKSQLLVFSYSLVDFRFSFYFVIFCIVILFSLFFFKKKSFYFINIFLVLLSINVLMSSPFNFQLKRVFVPGFTNMHISSSGCEKPIVFILLDEYSSPVELRKVFFSDSVFNFSRSLKSRGWVVKDSFYSHNRGTVKSLGSMFNYNLSCDSFFSKATEKDLLPAIFEKSLLARDLEEKGVSVVNNGIFPLGKSKPTTRLYFYPQNLLEVFFSKSVYPRLVMSLSDASLLFKPRYYNFYSHNKKLFSRLRCISSSSASFFYFHFYMPHAPLFFGKEFQTSVNGTYAYLGYYSFTNKKLFPFLDSLITLNKFKVIVTGDHGYREDSRINPNLTFAAFYGFDTVSVNMINSVQDLGLLINSQFGLQFDDSSSKRF